MTDQPNYSLPLFIYDDKCTLCVRFKVSVEKIQGAHLYQMIPLSEDEVFKAFPLLEKNKCQKEFHLIDENGKIFSGSEAIKVLIKNIPAVENFSWLIESKMGSKAIDYFYKMSNKYRQSLLNKCRSCR